MTTLGFHRIPMSRELSAVALGGAEHYAEVVELGSGKCLEYAIAAFRGGHYNRVLAYVCAASEALTKESAPLARCCTFSGGEPHPVALDADGHCIYCGFGACGDDDGAGGGA